MTYDQREDLYAIHARRYGHAQSVQKFANEYNARIQLSLFLDALDEWGCDDNEERAKAILEFQKSGYDLSLYKEKS